MIILGLLLGIIGADVNSGTFRFDFGIAELQDGIDFVAISMGLFGFTEIIVNCPKAKRAIPLQKRSLHLAEPKRINASRACHHARHFAGFLPRHSSRRRSSARFLASYTLEKKVGGKTQSSVW